MTKFSEIRLPMCNIRLLDTILTFFGLWIFFYLIQVFVGKCDYFLSIFTSMLLSVLTMFPIAILFHTIFGVPTALNCSLGLAPRNKCIEKGFK